MAVVLRCNNDTRETWVSATGLAEDCALSERTVRAALKALADAGWLTLDDRKGTSPIITFAEATPEPKPRKEIPEVRKEIPGSPDRVVRKEIPDHRKQFPDPRKEIPDTPERGSDDLPIYPTSAQSLPQPEVPDGWDRVVDAWHGFQRAAKLTPRGRPSPDKGIGRDLRALQSDYGTDNVVDLLAWLSSSSQWSPVWYRNEETSNGKRWGKVATPKNIRTNAEKLFQQMDTERASQPNGNTAPDPWLSFVTLARQSGFDFERFKLLIPERDRDRFVAAARASGAWARLRNSSHDLERDRIRNDFIAALEAA